MDKKALRKIIREEVQNELYEILPALLKEAITDMLGKPAAAPRATPKVVVREAASTRPSKEFDPTRLRNMLGYGEMEEGRSAMPTPARRETPRSVAGIPMEGGLRAHESAAGQGHLNDVSHITGPLNEEAVAEEYNPVAAGAVPDFIVRQLGSRAKQVLEEAERKSTWRPGKKK